MAGSIAFFLMEFAMISVPLISIVDDDDSVRESLEGLLKSVGFRVEAFALAGDFLNSKALHATGCLILDVRMPGNERSRTSAEVDREPAFDPDHFHYSAWRRGGSRACLGDGAVDCLLKPFNEDVLLNAVNAALGRAGAESASGRKSMR